MSTPNGVLFYCNAATGALIVLLKMSPLMYI